MIDAVNIHKKFQKQRLPGHQQKGKRKAVWCLWLPAR